MKWRKRHQVDAIQWDGNAKTLAKIVSFCLPRKAFMPMGNDSGNYTGLEPAMLHIETLEGILVANIGDWILKGIEGECWPCREDIFKKTYEQADESPIKEDGEDELWENVVEINERLAYAPLNHIVAELKHKFHITRKEFCECGNMSYSSTAGENWCGRCGKQRW